ncbi:hypothetical protein O181_000793 [Austropuccinia psidii MF-1]|uniref:Uncharacterized protein n=1 Tax=Austropuccinia psidii MF-1 TaxID=1389203 RepID=A0A9Q3GB60_9BASI|nr:hypothetical protein [Austropuccinia psidii MF-1]
MSKDDSAMDTTLLICHRAISWTGIFTRVISERNPKLISALWKNLKPLFGTKLSFSTAQYPQTDGLAEIMIQALEEMTPDILEKGWIPRPSQESLRKDLVVIHPTAASFKGMLDKARKKAVRCMEDSFSYSKEKWDSSHATTDFKVGDLVLVSTITFNNIEGFRNLKDYFEGPFAIEGLHGENFVEVKSLEEIIHKNPTFQVSLIKH